MLTALRKKCFRAKQAYFQETTKKGKCMPKITVDNIEYNTEDLSENGKAQLASLQFLEVQMAKLKSEIAVYQTARMAYMTALKNDVEKTDAD